MYTHYIEVKYFQSVQNTEAFFTIEIYAVNASNLPEFSSSTNELL